MFHAWLGMGGIGVTHGRSRGCPCKQMTPPPAPFPRSAPLKPCAPDLHELLRRLNGTPSQPRLRWILCSRRSKKCHLSARPGKTATVTDAQRRHPPRPPTSTRRCPTRASSGRLPSPCHTFIRCSPGGPRGGEEEGQGRRSYRRRRRRGATRLRVLRGAVMLRAPAGGVS